MDEKIFSKNCLNCAKMGLSRWRILRNNLIALDDATACTVCGARHVLCKWPVFILSILVCPLTLFLLFAMIEQVAGTVIATVALVLVLSQILIYPLYCPLKIDRAGVLRRRVRMVGRIIIFVLLVAMLAALAYVVLALSL